jgi:SAM-dependent methyltransferase
MPRDSVERTIPHDSVNSGWDERASIAYSDLIVDDRSDSEYLRRQGLVPNVLELVGECRGASVLDVGCGTGWLLDRLPHARGLQCDVLPEPTLQADQRFSVQNVLELGYEADQFDVVVASLVLMWVDDLIRACRELNRVTRPRGRLVVALTHPFSYRTGRATSRGDYVIEQRYSIERRVSDLMIGGKVGPFVYYHRPIHRYLNAFAECGWRICSMREWSIDLEDYKRAGVSRSDGAARTDRVPMFAFFSCEKS